MSDIGHNSVAADELRGLIERIERLEEEKKGLADDIRDVYAESKARGFDTKTMREVIKLRKMERHARQEREALLETYKAALGMDFSETPLGDASVRRAAEKLVNTVRSSGGSMTIQTGEQEVTIS